VTVDGQRQGEGREAQVPDTRHSMRKIGTGFQSRPLLSILAVLERRDIFGLRSFRSLRNLELYGLAFGQRFKT
jgi:hypothetical protein